MEAGRELDVLVAEKVMGMNVRGWAWAYMDEMSCWNIEHVGNTEDRATKEDLCAVYAPGRLETEYFGPLVEERWPDGIPQWAVESDKQSRSDWDKDVEAWGTYRGMLNPVPAYSTEIAAVWKVVEKTRGLVSLETEFELFAYEDGTWNAAFGIEDGVSADTAPHAICLAALRAVGCSLEEEES